MVDRQAWLQRQREKDLERLRRLRPIDDTFMRRMFQDDLPLAEFVLRIILDKPDLKLVSAETQKDLMRLVGARSICLDVHGVDSANRKYDIEVQRDEQGASPERARYHSAAMDIEALDAGQDFEALPETYTIFITESDIFGAGEGLYTIERVNLTTGKLFNDREHILYVNAQYRGDDPLGRLMHDFLCSDPSRMHYDIMADRTRYFKENVEGVSEMCRIMEELRTESIEFGREEGMEKGRREGQREGRLSTLLQSIRHLKDKLGYTDQQARDLLNISNEDWEEVAPLL